MTLDKMAALFSGLGMTEKFILLADAYYVSKKMILYISGCKISENMIYCRER